VFDDSGRFVLPPVPGPPAAPDRAFVFWVILGLLLLLAVLLVLLGVVLVGYKRWLDRDARHKARVEAQLGRMTEVLEHLAECRTDSAITVPRPPGSTPPRP
jgi:hypothetical protein